MGVLNCVFGGLGVICGGTGALVHSMLRSNPDAQALLEYVEKEVPSYALVEMTKVIGALLIGIWVIIAGVGLLRHQKWGGILTLIAAGATLLLHIPYMYYELKIVTPVVEEFVREQVGMMRMGMQGGATRAGIVLGSGLFLIHAGVMLVSFLIPSAWSHFIPSGQRHHPDYEDDYDEDYEDDFEPRRGRDLTRRPEWDEREDR